MNVREFIEQTVEAVNQRVGFPILDASHLLDFIGEVRLDAIVQWRHARRSMEGAFQHLQEDHQMLCDGVDLPEENGSTYQSCARKLCAAVASKYAPQFPSLKEWNEDESMRVALRCCVLQFVVRMLIHSGEDSKGANPMKEAAKEKSGPRFVAVDLAQLKQILRSQKESPAETRIPIEDARVLAVNVMAHFCNTPQVLFVVAEIAKSLPTEAEQTAFLNRITLVLGSIPRQLDQSEIVTLIHQARGEKQQRPN